MRFISLAAVLFGFWLLLSGHYTALLVGLGVLSALGVALLARRMGVIDREGHPIELIFRAMLYWPWLVVEIIKSAWDVTKIIVDPALPISPQMIRVRATQKTGTGVTIYGNSITLTPGTITVGVKGNDLTIHAITRESAQGVMNGDMDARVTIFEGER